MKKLMAVGLLLAALAIGVMPSLAIPLSDLNNLAQYFPADTAIFAATRTDDAYFETIDQLVAKVSDALPPGAVPPFSVSMALDDALSRMDMTFAEDVRPWLGDTMAVGILEIPIQDGSATRMLESRRFDGDAPFLFAAAITDRAAAAAFFESVMASSNTAVERTDEGDYLVYEDPEGDGILIIRDDVLLLGNMPDRIPTGGLPDGSLSSSADFNDTFALLPEADYNMSVFVNLPRLLEIALEGDPDAAEIMGMFGNMFTAIGPQVWGATIIDDRHLVLDVAQRITDLSAFEAWGMAQPMAPLDPAFATHIPANAPLVYHGTDLNSRTEALFAVLERQGDLMREFDLPDDSMEETEQALDSFTTFTGLDLRDDVFSWMTGDYAAFLMLSPDLNTTSRFGVFATFPVDFGIAIEATDPAAAAATVAGLTEGLERLVALAEDDEDRSSEITLSTETMGGAEVTVMTINGRELPWPVELLLGANDEVFALGTRSAVQAIFARDGGLPSNATYIGAQELALENRNALAFFNPAGLLPLADLIDAYSEEEGDRPAQSAEAARRVLALINSITVSQSQNTDGSIISRFVLTLAE